MASNPNFRRIVMDVVTTEDITSKEGFARMLNELRDPLNMDSQLVMGSVVDHSATLEQICYSAVRPIPSFSFGTFGHGDHKPEAAIERACMTMGMDI